MHLWPCYVIAFLVQTSRRRPFRLHFPLQPSKNLRSLHYSRSKRANHWHGRLLGGILMLLVAVLYLLFENRIIPASKKSNQELSPRLDGVFRSILGIQAGLTVLAMIVTRSSIASLQARKGLPIGNQVTAWIVLRT